MKTPQEFAVGNHSIGYVSSDFKKYFGDTEFAERSLGTFQKLPRVMNDAEIESELKPGLCELGDILAFIENPPEGTKDGYANLFYTPSCVVDVRWYGGRWSVRAWRRGGNGWVVGRRVFSPATRSETVSSTLGAFDSSSLEAAIKLVKSAGYKIVKEI